jgi:S-adenosylmethionine hydrolase
MGRIVTLMTDFGLEDGYVAAMKGVILSLVPDAVLVDITHAIPPQDIRWGAYILKSCYADFPSGTIHTAVVDPGVGTERRPLASQTPPFGFMGPDTGLFSLVLAKEKTYEARVLENPAVRRPMVSATFHGRDIFAPAAAYLAAGFPFASLGPQAKPADPPWPAPKSTPGGIAGTVLGWDRFGNIVTSIEREHLTPLEKGGMFHVLFGSQRIRRFGRTYADAPPGHALALLGSSNHLEIAVNQGNAAERFSATRGQSVEVIFL